MSDEQPRLRVNRVGLKALGGTVVAVACVPKVSATLVIDQTRSADHQQRERSGAPKPVTKPGTDRVPPTVVRAELIGGDGLRIYFSEPIVAGEGFDPADFRISALMLDRRGYGGGYGGYAHTADYQSYSYYYDPGNLSCGEPLELAAVHVSGNRVDISFSSQMGTSFCQDFSMPYSAGYRDPSEGMGGAGLFLHYAAGSIPIRDTAGNPLANFGADWVISGRGSSPLTTQKLDAATASRAGEGLVSVACGPPIPPGPR